jgi:hypothetical protein
MVWLKDFYVDEVRMLVDRNENGELDAVQESFLLGWVNGAVLHFDSLGISTDVSGLRETEVVKYFGHELYGGNGLMRWWRCLCGAGTGFGLGLLHLFGMTTNCMSLALVR